MTKSDAQNKKKGEKNQPLAPTYLSSIYLEYVKLTNFGKFANMIVGPFKPGLNVVYGANEAGKTTISELIKNVMFGWRASRRGSNSYKPENSERIGSLFFKDDRTGDVEEIKRTKNSEGVVDRLHVLDDIDKETYETMFALNSDELLKLDRHNEVTARLLTAGSGTASSPAIVLAKIQEKIRALMSRSAQTPDSIALLREEQEREKTLVQELLNETDSFYEEEHRLESLLARKEALTEAQAGLNTEIEELKSNYARLEGIDASIEQNTALLEETRASEQQMRFPIRLKLMRMCVRLASYHLPKNMRSKPFSTISMKSASSTSMRLIAQNVKLRSQQQRLRHSSTTTISRPSKIAQRNNDAFA